MATIKKTKEEDPFAQYDRLVEKAKVEGRIDGPCKCVSCGMRYLTQDEARDCCKEL